MAGIGVVWFIIFKYVPMAGVSISLLDYRPAAGFAGSEWLGLRTSPGSSAIRMPSA